MSFDPTNYKPLTQTQPVYRHNPYEQTSPYGYDEMPPPPPLSRQRVRWIVLGVCIVGLVVLLGGFLAIALQHHTGAVQTTTRTTPTAAPTMPPSSTVSATPSLQPTVNLNYTATDILHDLNAAGIHPKFVEYNTTIWSWTADTYTVTANATSSVNFTDDSSCTGYCSPANIGIWVYDNPATAMQAYNEVLNDEHQPNASIPMMGIPSPTLHGRCLLLSNSDQPIYEQVVMQDCV